jgi:hypothetical protein
MKYDSINQNYMMIAWQIETDRLIIVFSDFTDFTFSNKTVFWWYKLAGFLKVWNVHAIDSHMQVNFF